MAQDLEASPVGLAGRVVTANQNDGSLSLIDLATGAVVPVPVSASAAASPSSICSEYGYEPEVV